MTSDSLAAVHRAAIARVVDAYQPRDFEPDEESWRLLEVTKTLVARVEWATPKAAGSALTHAYAFIRWADPGIDVLGQTVGRTVVDRFIHDCYEGRPIGTQTAVRSYLTRIVDGDAVLRQSDRDKSTPRPCTPALDCADDSHLRSRVLQEDEAVAAFVASILGTVAWESRERPRWQAQLITALAKRVDQEHRPLRVDVVFSTSMLEEFLGSLPRNTPLTSLATYASILYRIQAALLPEDERGHGKRTARTPTKRASIYSDNEIDKLIRWAERRRSSKARRHWQALIALVLATGADGSEAGRVRASHVLVRDDRVDVTLHEARGVPRTVPVSGPWAAELAISRRRAYEHSDIYLIGSGARESRASMMSGYARAAGLDFDLSRLRDTAIVRMCRDHRLPELLACLGVETPGALDRIWPAVMIASAAQ